MIFKMSIRFIFILETWSVLNLKIHVRKTNHFVRLKMHHWSFIPSSSYLTTLMQKFVPYSESSVNFIFQWFMTVALFCMILLKKEPAPSLQWNLDRDFSNSNSSYVSRNSWLGSEGAEQQYQVQLEARDWQCISAVSSGPSAFECPH